MSTGSPTSASEPAAAGGQAAAGRTVRASAWVRRGAWVLMPVVGAVIALLVRVAAEWITTLEWFPFQGVFELAVYFDEPWASATAAAVGAAIGLGFPGLWARERVSLTASREAVAVHQGARTRRFEADAVGTAFLDGRQLVLLTPRGAELARYATKLDARQLRLALQEHGYRWAAEDPHAGRYRRWDADDPDLPLRVNALLAERQRALRPNNHADPEALRVRLRELDVVVRDRGREQCWRFAEARSGEAAT
ncbi:YqeB family protein [Salinifilum ghardaiensis]